MKNKKTNPTNLTELYALALDTFGSESKANTWLHKDNLALGTTPIAMAQSDDGLIEVKKLLNAISSGGVV